jgi:hypothetical protein
MNNTKMLDALKAFEIQDLSRVEGGYCKITWANAGLCDIYNSSTGTETCNVSDGGVQCGQYIWGCG